MRPAARITPQAFWTPVGRLPARRQPLASVPTPGVAATPRWQALPGAGAYADTRFESTRRAHSARTREGPLRLVRPAVLIPGAGNPPPPLPRLWSALARLSPSCCCVVLALLTPAPTLNREPRFGIVARHASPNRDRLLRTKREGGLPSTAPTRRIEWVPWVA